MNATLTNLTTVYANGRPVATAVLRSSDGTILKASSRLADQLIYAQSNGVTIDNTAEILNVLCLTLGFAS